MQRPLWKDYLSAVVRTSAKLVPGVSCAVEVIETVENRRDAINRHEELTVNISRVEKTIVETIEREMKAVLAKLQMPNLSENELEEEIANLYSMRHYGREPFMSEGLLVNSQWYEKLRQKPNLYGRVMQDRDIPNPECFYLFLDADKGRLLEVSPFALQQLLAHQMRGAPEAKIVGCQDVFAERVEADNKTSSKNKAEPQRVESSTASPQARTVSNEPIALPPNRKRESDTLVRENLPNAQPQHQSRDASERVSGTNNTSERDRIVEAAWHLDSTNNRSSSPSNDRQAAILYRQAAEMGDTRAMYMLGWMYRNGQGVPQSSAEARKWFGRAAELGDKSSQNELPRDWKSSTE